MMKVEKKVDHGDVLFHILYHLYGFGYKPDVQSGGAIVLKCLSDIFVRRIYSS